MLYKPLLLPALLVESTSVHNSNNKILEVAHPQKRSQTSEEPHKVKAVSVHQEMVEEVAVLVVEDLEDLEDLADLEDLEEEVAVVVMVVVAVVVVVDLLAVVVPNQRNPSPRTTWTKIWIRTCSKTKRLAKTCLTKN